jgi:sec-independent protein translocase protein TatA
LDRIGGSLPGLTGPDLKGKIRREDTPPRPARATTIAGHGRPRAYTGHDIDQEDLMPDWAIVAIIAVVVLFGASKLPDIARNLGRSSGEFKKGLKEGHEGAKEESDAADAASDAPAAPSPTTTTTTPPLAEPAHDEPRSENPA